MLLHARDASEPIAFCKDPRIDGVCVCGGVGLLMVLGMTTIGVK